MFLLLAFIADEAPFKVESPVTAAFGVDCAGAAYLFFGYFSQVWGSKLNISDRYCMESYIARLIFYDWISFCEKACTGS